MHMRGDKSELGLIDGHQGNDWLPVIAHASPSKLNAARTLETATHDTNVGFGRDWDAVKLLLLVIIVTVPLWQRVLAPGTL